MRNEIDFLKSQLVHFKQNTQKLEFSKLYAKERKDLQSFFVEK
ncbi:hypothetical protein J2Y38_004398 [Flavobacterium sp. 2755]|nr:hypothetical protein [Flavobacterium sp. 2755]